MSPETHLGFSVGLGGLTAVLDTTVAVLDDLGPGRELCELQP